MDQKLRNFYLEAQINNASSGQRLVMLYDGLIQFAENADAEMTSPEKANDPRPAGSTIARCIDILTELSTSLQPSVEPKLCAQLNDLYLFFTRQFSEAFDRREPKKIQAILPLIRDLRNTWVEADRRAGQATLLEAIAA
jgi:flagellar secretion chaperone FliS